MDGTLPDCKISHRQIADFPIADFQIADFQIADQPIANYRSANFRLPITNADLPIADVFAIAHYRFHIADCEWVMDHLTRIS